MNHEIVGPEITVNTGQLRLPKGEAITRHIAQYSTPSMFRVEEPKTKSEMNDVENLKAEQTKIQLEALELVHTRFSDDRMVRKDLAKLGIPDAISDNWVERHEVSRLQQLQERAKQHNCHVSIPSIENMNLDKLELEMNAMLKVINLPAAIVRVIRE